MAFFDSHFFSDALGLSVSAYVLLPQRTTEQIGMVSGQKRSTYPTLYLLHGLSDDHTIWMRRTSIERYAAARNIAVVMPAVARSFYQDMASGPKYWTFVSEELPALMRQFFPLSSAREENYVAGLSMGGYGALRLGLACPDKFAAAASLSGALDYAKRVRDADKLHSRMNLSEWLAIAGPERIAEGSTSDLFHLAREAVKHPAPTPNLYLCCGTEDSLLEDSRALHRHLDALQFAHTYEESSGTHEWSYWDAQIQRVLNWLPVPTA